MILDIKSPCLYGEAKKEISSELLKEDRNGRNPELAHS